jgi:hypothetical protein
MTRTLFAPTSTASVAVARQRALGGYAWQSKCPVHAIPMGNTTARRLRRLLT